MQVCGTEHSDVSSNIMIRRCARGPRDNQYLYILELLDQ